MSDKNSIFDFNDRFGYNSPFSNWKSHSEEDSVAQQMLAAQVEKQLKEENNGPNMDMGYASAVDAAKKYLTGVSSVDANGNDNEHYQHNFTALRNKIENYKNSISDIKKQYQKDGMSCMAGMFFAYYLGSKTVREYLLKFDIGTRRGDMFLFFRSDKSSYKKRDFILPGNYQQAGRGDIFFDGFATDPWDGNRGHTGLLTQAPELNGNQLILHCYAAYFDNQFKGGKITFNYKQDKNGDWWRKKKETLPNGTKVWSKRYLIGFGRLYEMRIRGWGDLKGYQATEGEYPYSIKKNTGTYMDYESIRVLNANNPGVINGEGGKAYVFKNDV